MRSEPVHLYWIAGGATIIGLFLPLLHRAHWTVVGILVGLVGFAFIARGLWMGLSDRFR